MARQIGMRNETQKVKSKKGKVIHTAEKTPAGSLQPISTSKGKKARTAQQSQNQTANQNQSLNQNRRQAFRQMVSQSFGGASPVTSAPRTASQGLPGYQTPQMNPYAKAAVRQITPAFQRPVDPITAAAANMLRNNARGNIDLYNRPEYRQPDGSISTVNSISIGTDEGAIPSVNGKGLEVLIPTIGRDANGRPVQWTDEQAIEHYKKTGENLGKFKTVEEANDYAEKLHKQQEAYYSPENSPLRLNGVVPRPFEIGDAVKRFEAGEQLHQNDPEADQYIEKSIRTTKNPFANSGINSTIDPQTGDVIYTAEHGRNNWLNDYNVQENLESDEARKARTDALNLLIARGRGDDRTRYESTVLRNMNEDEQKEYSYILGKFGREQAEKYLDLIGERVTNRRAAEIVENVNRDVVPEDGSTPTSYVNPRTGEVIENARSGKNPINSLARAGKMGKLAAQSGLDMFMSGVSDKFTNYVSGGTETTPATAEARASQAVKEQLNPLGRLAYDVVENEAMMAPTQAATVAASLLFPPLAPAAATVGAGASIGSLAAAKAAADAPQIFGIGATMFPMSAGQAYEEGLQKGLTPDQARFYGTLEGLNQAGLEYALGGFEDLSGGFAKNAVDRVLGNVVADETKSQAAQTVARAVQHFLTTPEGRMAFSMGSEAFEEIVQGSVSNALNNAFFGENNGPVSQEDLYSALVAALSAGMSNSRYYARGYANGIGRVYSAEDIRAAANNIITDRAAYVNQEAYDAAMEQRDQMLAQADYVEQGGKLTPLERGELGDAAGGALAEMDRIGRRARNESDIQEVADTLKTAQEIAQTEETKQEVEKISTRANDIIKRRSEGAQVTDAEVGRLINDTIRTTLVAGNEKAAATAEARTRMGFGEQGNTVMESSQATGQKAEVLTALYEEARYDIQRNDAQKQLASTLLSEQELSAMYQAGIQDRNAFYNTDYSDKIGKIAEKYRPGNIKRGNVTYDGVDMDALQKAGDNESRAKYAQMKTIEHFLAGTLGYNVEWFESKTADGKYEGENGSYNRAKNLIRLDINAGAEVIGDKVKFASVIAHELTHTIENGSPMQYQKIADTVMKALVADQEYSRGRNAEQIVADMIENNPYVKNEADAVHELVAQACEDMMNGNADVRAMFEGMSESERNTIFDHISNIFAAIKNFFDDLLNSDSVRSNRTETAAIRRAKENIESLEKEWTEGVKRAAAYNAAAYEEAQRQSAEGEQEASEIDPVEQFAEENNSNVEAFSIRQLAQAAGYDIVVTKKGKIPYAIVNKQTGKRLTKNEITKDVVKDTPMGKLIEAAVQNGTVSEEIADTQRQMFADLFGLIYEYKDAATVWQIASTVMYSGYDDKGARTEAGAVKSNSDPQYGTTIDFGTICAKTQAIIDVMSKTMLEKGRGLTRNEIVKIVYPNVSKANLSVPCPVCYVFSRWLGVPSLLNTMLTSQERFANATDDEINDYVLGLEKKYGDSKKIGSKKSQISASLTRAQRSASLSMAKIESGKLTEKQLAREQKKLDNALARMKRYDAQVAEIEAYNWVTQVLCETDNSRKAIRDENGRVHRDPDFKKEGSPNRGYVDPDILLDMRRTGEFAELSPKAWLFRTTRGAGMGKAIMPHSGETLGDIVRGSNSGNPIRYSDEKNPFYNAASGDAKTAADGMRDAVDAVKRAIKRAKGQNLIGGLRLQSTSDYRAEWGIDYMMAFFEMQAIGSQGQLYTKVIEAVDFLATTGCEVNLSIMGRGDGYHIDKNGNPVLDFSSVTGIDFDQAYEKTKLYDNVQMILVGLNNTHIRLALADDRIGFVIPWHSSGSSEKTLGALMRGVNEVLGNGTDYSPYQNDIIINEKDKADVRQLRLDILMGEFEDKGENSRKLTDGEKAILNGNEWLKSLYHRFYEDESAKEYGVHLSKDQAEHIFPYEYWDTSLTVDKADENGRRFVEYCGTLGIAPRFSGYFSDKKGQPLKYNGETDFTKDPGYWKLLIDRRMYNRNGTYHEPKAVDVTQLKVNNIETPKRVNSNSYNDTRKINRAVRNTLSDLQRNEEIGNELKVTPGTDSGTQMSARSKNNPAVFEGQPFWSGSVSLIDGVIEEVHSYEEAEGWDFHHSMYFSPEQLDKMDGDQNAFFTVENRNGKLEVEAWRDDIPDNIIRKIREQIEPSAQYSSRETIGKVNAESVAHVTEDSVSAMLDNGYTAREATEAAEVGGFVQYSTRTSPAPKKTITAYKAFYAIDGKLYPPMVANDVEEEQNKGKKKVSGTLKGLETPVGIWIDADVGALAYDDNGKPLRNTKGRLAVKNAKGGGTLAFRPGWHLGLWPDAKQFNVKDPVTGELKACMPDGLVFARCSVAADNDYQLEALGYGMKDNGKFGRTQAGLPRIPANGYYMYRTNVDPTTAPWIISGAIRVEEILDDDMAAEICKQYGITADPRASHKKINLADYGLKAGPVTPTEDTDRFLPNDAVRANAVALEEALNDPAYANAYVVNSVNFDDPEIVKELARNGQSAEFYKAAQKKYGNKSYAVDNPNDSLINKNTFAVGSGNSQYSSRLPIVRDKKVSKAQEKRDRGEMLTERQFYQIYSAHKLNLRGLDNLNEQIENIKAEGFKGDGGFGNNVVPASINPRGYTEAEMLKDGYTQENINWKKKNQSKLWVDGRYYPSVNLTQRQYGARKGDTVMFVSEADLDVTKDTQKVKRGYRPFDYEIVTVERDYQPYYELYKKAYEQSRNNADVQYSSRINPSEYAPTFYSKLQREIQSYKGEKIGAASVESYLKGKGVKDEEIKWSGIRTFLEGKKSVNKAELMQYLRDNELQIEEKILGGETDNGEWTNGYNTVNVNYFYDPVSGMEFKDEESFRKEALKKAAEDHYDESELVFNISDDYMSVESEDGDVIFEAYPPDTYELRDSDYSPVNGTKWESYKLDGGKNYREILFSIPGSDYINGPMRTHWKGQTGVLAHARVQDFDSPDGKKTLFVEEIQSDWHNEGQKGGYLGDYKAEYKEDSRKWVLKDKEGKIVTAYSQMAGADDRAKVESAFSNYLRDKAAPDAPFRSNYTDYVLKNLLRMAAEGDYDYLAWTTGKMQEERWSDQYAEGYRIEYDQQIPKFLKKYGKQWGAGLQEVILSGTGNISEDGYAKEFNELYDIIQSNNYDLNSYGYDLLYEEVVDKAGRLESTIKQMADESDKGYERAIELAKLLDEAYNNGSLRRATTVPAIVVNDAMKESVLTEGQPMFSARSNGFDQRTSLGTVEELERRNENIWHINYTLDQMLRDRGAQTQKISDHQIKRIANRFIREYNSKADADTIAEGLKAMYEYIDYGAKISAQQVGKIATAYAEQIIDESKDVDDTMAAMYPGLGDDIKRTKLYVSPEAMKEMAYYFDGAADFRRQAKKFLTISERPGNGRGIDTFYEELSESYPELFDQDVVNEKDQLLQIFDVAEQLKAKTIDKDWGSEYDEVAYTLGQDLVAAYFAEKGDSSYKRSIDQIKVQMTKDHKEQMANLRRYKDQQIKEIKDKLTGERRTNTAQIAELRARLQEKYRQREEKASLRRLTTQAKAKLQRQARQLWSKRGTPEFERLKAKLFSELDLVSVGITKGGRLSLEKTYNEARKQAMLDPDYAASADYENLKLKFLGDPANPSAERKHLRDLSYEEIVDLTQDIIALKHSQQTYDKVLKENYEAKVADYGRRGVAQQGRVNGIINQKGRRAVMLAAVKKYALYMENPVRAAHLLDGYQEGGVLTELFDDINDGTTKKTRFQQQTNQMFEEILKDKKLTGGWSDQNIEINVGAGKYYISKGMRISIALHARNADNIRHVSYGGFNIPDERLYKAGRYTDAYNAGTQVQMTEEEMKQIASEMTSEEKKFANIAYTFFNHTTKKAINETSMVLKGYELAVVPNYMPIRTDPNFTQAEIDGLIHDGTIEGKGQFKDRKPGASNPILLEDIAQVIERQTQTTAAYCGLAIPVRNMNKVWKYTATAYKASMKDAIAKNWGQLGKDTIENMIKDIQAGARRGDTGDHVFSFLKGAQAASTLTMNVGVSMKQFASYPLAISMLDADCLMKGLRAKTDRTYIDSITPWSWDRRHGMGGEEMGDIFKQKGMIARNQTVQNIKNFVNWIQAVDVFTTDHLFAACEAQVQKDNPDLEVRGEEYNQKVAALYNEVLWRTQPSYGVMQRNELLRSSSSIMKALTMYKTQTFNMGGEILDAGLRAITMRDMAKNGLVSNDEVTKANQNLKKVLWGTVLSQATLAALSAVAAAALRKMRPYRDDKGEITAGSLMQKVGTDFITSWFGLFFGADLAEQAVGSVLNFAKWYDVTAPQLDGLNDTVSDMSAWSTALGDYIGETDMDKKSEKKAKLVKTSAKMAMTTAGTFGVPTTNVYNMLNALNLLQQDASEDGGGFLSFEAGEGLLGLTDTAPTKEQYARQAVYYSERDDAERVAHALKGTNKANLEKVLGSKLSKNLYESFLDDSENLAKYMNVKQGGITPRITDVPDDGYSSFTKLREAIGDPERTQNWHHIVEQEQGPGEKNFGTFSATQINNKNNIVSIPSGSKSPHSAISQYYGTVQDFTGGKTVREWLSTKSFEEQFDFGVKQLQKYGDIIPTGNGWAFVPDDKKIEALIPLSKGKKEERTETQKQWETRMSELREDGGLTGGEVRNAALTMIRDGLTADEALELYRQNQKSDKKLDEWKGSFEDYLKGRNAVDEAKAIKDSDKKLQSEKRKESIESYLRQYHGSREDELLLWKLMGYSENTFEYR